jgi:hypothetical protein
MRRVTILSALLLLSCVGCNTQKLRQAVVQQPWYPSDPELLTWAAQARTTVCGTASPTPEQEKEICHLVRAQVEQAQKDWAVIMTDRYIRSAELDGRQLMYRRVIQGY